jgi:hypothetical protein
VGGWLGFSFFSATLGGGIVSSGLGGSTVLSRGGACSTSLFATVGASSLGRVMAFAFGILSRFTLGGYHSLRENGAPFN